MQAERGGRSLWRGTAMTRRARSRDEAAYRSRAEDKRGEFGMDLGPPRRLKPESCANSRPIGRPAVK